MRKRVAFAALLPGTIVAYLLPLEDADHVIWITPPYHPEYYREAVFPFTGYAYPLLLVALFAAATLPIVIGSAELPSLNGAIATLGSKFTLLLLGVLSVVFVMWVALTPVF